MPFVNRGPPHPGPNIMLSTRRPVSFATKELGLLLHITTYYAQCRGFLALRSRPTLQAETTVARCRDCKAKKPVC